MVARGRLFARLRDGRGLNLTLVACPAGFGKSTLLAAWRERDAEDRPGAWVTLDEGDDDAVVLWAHVIEALGRVCPGIAPLAASVVSAPLREVVLPRLVNQLAEQRDVVLVLDDFHRVSSAAARDSVAWFADHLPATVQLVLSTRADPGLPLGALRAHGRLLELRTDELRFTGPEAAEFLNGRLGLGLDEGDVELLVARTEGWPAGLYLAALSLAGKPDKPALVRAFDGTSAHVVEFLSDEVLAGYPPELQDFMVRTSILERLCAPLCDAVLGGAAADGALGRARAHEPLPPAARRPAALVPVPPPLRPAAARGAGAARAGGDAGAAPARPRVASRLGHHGRGDPPRPRGGRVPGGRRADRGDLGRPRQPRPHLVGPGVAGRLPRRRARRRPAPPARQGVGVGAARARGRHAERRRPRARARRPGGGPLPDGFASLEASVSVLSAAFAWGDAGAVLAEGARSAELEGPDSPWRPVVSWSLGWAHYCRGELEPAERWFQETAALAPRTDQWIVGIGAVADLSLIAGMRGRRSEQQRLAAEAVGLARERGLLEAIEVGEVHTAHGVALAAAGRREEALAALEQGVFLRRLWGQPLDLADGLVALAPAVAATGDRARAADLFGEAEALLGGCRDAGVLPARLAAAKRTAGFGRAAAGGGALSERELMVVRLLSGGLSEREIGQELFVSYNTVHTHVKSVYRKLGVSSRADAVARAREQRLLT